MKVKNKDILTFTSCIDIVYYCIQFAFYFMYCFINLSPQNGGGSW